MAYENTVYGSQVTLHLPENYSTEEFESDIRQIRGIFARQAVRTLESLGLYSFSVGKVSDTREVEVMWRLTLPLGKHSIRPNDWPPSV